jgi:proline iminopeptidase
MSPTSPEIRAGSVETERGIRIHYRIRGEGNSTLVAPAESWLGEDLEALTGNRTLLSFDLRGRGASSAIEDDSRLGLDRDVADLEALRSARGVEQFSLFGWSYYAAVVMRYALAHPDRVERIVLAGPCSPRAVPYFGQFLDRFALAVDAKQLDRLEEQRRDRLAERDPIAWCRAVHGLFFRAYVADPRCLARMKSSPCVEPNLDPARVNDQGRRVIEKLGDYDWTGDFASLVPPVLVVHGSEDPVPLEGSQEWVRILPRARLRVMQGVGHMPWLERPEEFFPLVMSFLSENPTGG